MSKHAAWGIRLALFAVYAWFGVLKLMSLSPATQIVHQLHQATIPFVSFQLFYYAFALFEVLIGVLFIIPRYTKIAFALIVVHLIATALPLVMLPVVTWHGLLQPTLEGQYILKNLIILAAAYALFSYMRARAKRI